MLRTIKISNNVYWFSSYIESIGMTYNQYLIIAEKSLLIHTGPGFITDKLIPEIVDLLNGKKLYYIFTSHFEGDECGGLSKILKKFPEVKPICSQVCSKQLKNFDLYDSPIIQTAETSFGTENYVLKFIEYPSEVHLWNGLIVFENNTSILFSSDLFMQFGRIESDYISISWNELLSQLTEKSTLLPTEKLDKLKREISHLHVSLVAPGHGPCIKIIN